MSLAQRHDMQLADDLTTMTDMVDNRIEWMAAQALIYGYVDVVGDDYPLVRVDFQRNGAQQVALAGANLWSAAATAAPVTNLDTWANLVSGNQGGSVTDVVCGANVWAQFARSAEVKDLYKNVQNPGGPLPSLLPGVMDNEQKIYRGQFGQFRFWSYNATYQDDNGASQFFVPANDVVLVAKQALQGVQTYGAIMDHEALTAAKYFPKMWKQEDPSVVYSMVQSAPLVVPRSVNSTFRATVL
jgi:Phage major capsid protein E